ncbi:MAG TPA: hypothetical protein VLN57_07460 [Xanthobacteraceae bacterium]|nr:hypothetical protein [Xanthobacteraceae bacterium]
MYTVDELKQLAQAYIDATGITRSRLGTRAANNDRLFMRLANGFGCTAETAERASWWFARNWPEEAEWPKSIKRPRHGKRVLTAAARPAGREPG